MALPSGQARQLIVCVKNSAFGVGRGGLPGNDDSGGLSSWFVWASLGLFPVAGQILFLQDGYVVERGSHRALLATPYSAYGRFVQLQTYGAT